MEDKVAEDKLKVDKSETEENQSPDNKKDPPESVSDGRKEPPSNSPKVSSDCEQRNGSGDDDSKETDS